MDITRAVHTSVATHSRVAAFPAPPASLGLHACPTEPTLPLLLHCPLFPPPDAYAVGVGGASSCADAAVSILKEVVRKASQYGWVLDFSFFCVAGMLLACEGCTRRPGM